MRQTRRVEHRKRGRRASLSSATEDKTEMKTRQADTNREAANLSTVAPASSKIVTEKQSEAKLSYYRMIVCA